VLGYWTVLIYLPPKIGSDELQVPFKEAVVFNHFILATPGVPKTVKGIK